MALEKKTKENIKNNIKGDDELLNTPQ